MYEYKENELRSRMVAILEYEETIKDFANTDAVKTDNSITDPNTV